MPQTTILKINTEITVKFIVAILQTFPALEFPVNNYSRQCRGKDIGYGERPIYSVNLA
jgi:hypothetical protein